MDHQMHHGLHGGHGMHDMSGHGDMDMGNGGHGGHGGMDHGGGGGGGGGMGGHDMMGSMEWNWATRDFAVVFRSWAVRAPVDFALTLVLVFALALLFERVMAWRAAIEAAANQAAAKRASAAAAAGGATPQLGSDRDPLLAHGVDMPPPAAVAGAFNQKGLLTPRQNLVRTLLYAFSHFMGIFLMLIFMTYNGWIILAAVAGAATGFHLFRQPGSMFGLEKSCCE